MRNLENKSLRGLALRANRLLISPSLDSSVQSTPSPEVARAVPGSDANDTVAYFDSTFDEAMSLAREARDYLAHQERTDLAKLGPLSRLSASCESMRLTARLTQVIAWLMVQKAVHAGELTREEASGERFRLGGREVCEADAPVVDEPLPERLKQLLARSHGLYERVARLDSRLDTGTH